MRGAGATHLQAAGASSGSQRWRTLLWKVALAGVLLALLFVGVPSPGQFLPVLVQGTVLLWGALFVWLAGSSLFGVGAAGGRPVTEVAGYSLQNPPSGTGSHRIRWAWCVLAVGAYAALAIPVVVTGDASKTVDGLAPVAALTLVAHLGRTDLQRALRDWAVVMGLALYAALGISAMWLVLVTFNLAVFSLAVLLPPLVLEVALLFVRRFSGVGEGWRYALALLPSTALAIAIISTTQLNPSMNVATSIIFDVIMGVLIGGALLISLLTRPMTEAASGGAGTSGISVSRALLEFTHGAMLIALAVYIPLKLFIR